MKATMKMISRVTMLLVVCMLVILSCTPALADGKDGQILFREIPWGSTYNEVISRLPNGIEMKSPVGVYHWYPLHEVMSFDTGIGKTAWTDLGFLSQTEENATAGMKVAGYDVSQIHLYFAYLPDASGKLPRDDAHTAFFCGYYTIHPIDVDVVYEDLKSKLTSLYGACTEDNSNLCFWYGANDTMLSLARFRSNFGSNTIYIVYGYAGNDWILDAYEIETYVETENPSSSTEGL